MSRQPGGHEGAPTARPNIDIDQEYLELGSGVLSINPEAFADVCANKLASWGALPEQISASRIKISSGYHQGVDHVGNSRRRYYEFDKTDGAISLTFFMPDLLTIAEFRAMETKQASPAAYASALVLQGLSRASLSFTDVDPELRQLRDKDWEVRRLRHISEVGDNDAARYAAYALPLSDVGSATAFEVSPYDRKAKWDEKWNAIMEPVISETRAQRYLDDLQRGAECPLIIFR